MASGGQKREKWVAMIKLAKAQQWEKLEEEYPYEYIIQGSKLRALYFIQHTPPGERIHAQHLWIYGEPGTGKSALVEVLFPNCYKKRPDNDWLGYNPVIEPAHRTVYIPDFDMNSMKILKPEALKLMCDPQGFNANKKFAGGEIICPQRMIVTSNFRIGQCFVGGTPGIETQKTALHRRFREVEIGQYLQELGLRLKSEAELKVLKDANNFDYSKCFEDIPEENKAIKMAQEIIDLTMDTDDDDPFMEDSQDLTPSETKKLMFEIKNECGLSKISKKQRTQ